MWGAILAITENAQKGVQWHTLFHSVLADDDEYLSPGVVMLIALFNSLNFAAWVRYWE